MKNNTYFLIIFFIASLFLTLKANAQELSFDDVWSRIQKNSSMISSQELQTKALEKEKSRAQRHWLPRLYVNARYFRTNDPANIFVGILEQRSLTASDFDPNQINHPQAQNQLQGAIGLDLPLFLGGKRVAQNEMQGYLLNSQKNILAQTKINEYVEASTSFVSLAIYKKQQKQIEELSRVVKNLLKNYKLGQKSNPVGYSGLLGLKSLSNRLSGILNQYQSQLKSHHQNLKEMGLKDTNWSPKFTGVQNFSDTYLKKTSSSDSFALDAQKENAQASSALAKIKRAQYLPQIGAFAESTQFRGNRNTENSYNAGLYLKWDLFNPSDYGSYNEAKLKAQANIEYTNALTKKEHSLKEGLNASLEALKENLNLLEQSNQTSLEQVNVTEKLFKNGSINALQLAEVLNRRADVITQILDAEIQWLKLSTQSLQHEKFDTSNINKETTHE